MLLIDGLINILLIIRGVMDIHSSDRDWSAFTSITVWYTIKTHKTSNREKHAIKVTKILWSGMIIQRRWQCRCQWIASPIQENSSYLRPFPKMVVEFVINKVGLIISSHSSIGQFNLNVWFFTVVLRFRVYVSWKRYSTISFWDSMHRIINFIIILRVYSLL